MKARMLASLLLVVIIFPHPAIGQYVLGKGVIAGLSLSNWYGKEADDFADDFSYIMNESGFTNFQLDKKYRYGFCFGVFLDAKLNNILSLQPELYYAMKGVKFDGGGYLEGYSVDTQLTIKTNYIEIPVLLKLSTKESNQARFFLFFGPAVAIKTSSDIEVKVSIEGESDSDETEFEDVRGTDVGLVVGGGVSTSTGIRFDLRYNSGLLSVDDTNDQTDIKNRAISFILGFQY